MRQRRDWVDVAKGASIVLVVIYHTSLYLHLNDAIVDEVMKVNLLLAYFRMPTFFLISGILAARAVQTSWGSLFSHKIAILLWLLMVWTIIRYVFFGAVLENVVMPSEGHDLSLIFLAFVIPGTGLWFIWALAIFAALGKLVFLAPRWAVMSAIVVAAVISALAYAKVISFENFALNNLCLYFVFFLAGATFQEKIHQQLQSGIWLTAGLSAATFLAVFAITRIDADTLRPALGFFLALSGCAFALAASVLVARTRSASSVIRYLGANTLPIYVTHVMVVALLSHWIATQGNSKLANGALIPVVAGIAILVSLAIRDVVRRTGVVGLYELPRRVVAQLAPLATKTSP